MRLMFGLTITLVVGGLAYLIIIGPLGRSAGCGGSCVTTG